MPPALPAVFVTRKTGQEEFTNKGKPTGWKLNDFWQWYASDLLSNTLRGTLAEYIVSRALHGADGVRIEWDACDVRTGAGLKIEVKSAACLQSWDQERPSQIKFDIKPTQGWDAPSNTYDSSVRRQADVYVFCVLKHLDKTTVDPLNMDQWDFYVLPTAKLDRLRPKQKTIALTSLINLEPIKTGFVGLPEAVLQGNDASYSS